MHCQGLYCLKFYQSMNKLSINQLSKTYRNGVKALNRVSLEIGNGLFGLLGPNGAGKSSLMATIVGLQRPDSGTIRFNGVDIVDDPDFIKRQVGFLPQDFGVYPKVSAYKLLNHLALLKGVSDDAERDAQVVNLLTKVNLMDHRNREVHTFSGGMKQRFGIAQALLGNPRIIVVDEPTAGLDPEERNRINYLLSDIGEEIIVILSTHLVVDVQHLCSSLAVIRDGAILAFGRAADLLEPLQGMLWDRSVEKSEWIDFKTRYRVVTHYLVERSIHATVFSEHPLEGFRATAPTLEHVYFHLLL